MAVNKTELINKMAEKGKISKKEAGNEVELFLETLLDCLKEDGAVKLYGFGKFEIKTLKERSGRNPKTKEECMIPEHRKVKFYAGEALTDKINNE